MADSTVSPLHDARQVAAPLALPEITRLIADLDETGWTGRPGYPVRTMVGAVLAKAVYAIPTWTRTARLIADHAALREVIGGAPSHWACYRFALKLRVHDMLTACIDRVLATLRDANPEMGQTVAIDGSDMPAYANGHKHVGNKNGPLRTRFADPDAGWVTGRPFPPGKAARSTGTNCIAPWTPPRHCRSRGASGLPSHPPQGGGFAMPAP